MQRSTPLPIKSPLKINFHVSSFSLISNGNETYMVMVSVPVCLSVHVSNKLLSPLSDFKQVWQRCNYIPREFVRNNRPDSKNRLYQSPQQ